MLRETMMSTIPVAMTAMDALWTERFQRLRDVRKSPPERKWNASQITASAATMPASRVSISEEARNARQSRRCEPSAVAGGAECVSVTFGAPVVSVDGSLMSVAIKRTCPPPRRARGTSASQW